MEYDFKTLAENASAANGGSYGIFPITMTGSYGSIGSGQYGTSTTFNGYTVDLSRFAFRNNNDGTNAGRGWQLWCQNGTGAGLMYKYTEPKFAILDLRPDDEITIYFRGQSTRDASISFSSGSATQNGNALSSGNVLASASGGTEGSATIKATAKGDIIITTTNNGGTIFLTKIVINRPDVASYAYDPAIETYDLTGKTWTISEGASAGYSFAQYAANYISNPSGYELNNRIAIQKGLSGSWSYANGLKSGTRYRLLGISDLRDGDRVRVTFSGNIKFSSQHEVAKIETSFLAAGKVFYDADNDGEQDSNEDVTITNAGTNVESGAWYTMLEAGHLDLAVDKDAIITKIEIYSDRKAAYIDTDNGDGSHTLTFDGTGQLVEKTAYIPGLRMEFGDASKEAEHFFVTLSDHGPVSWGYDHQKFLMARRSDDGTSLSKAPGTGTFYKFIPEISGTLNIDFKALSVKYGNALTRNDPSNEEITNASCPYVFIKVDANGSVVTDMTPSNHNLGNGNLKTNYNNGFNLEKGYTYYFYGWWPGYENNNTVITESCGVAKLLSAKYTPSFMMPELACVTENGATSFDGSTSKPKIQITGSPQNLDLSVKKASENIDISKISLSLDSNGYLQITGISYKDDTKDHAGVILVKATANEGEHVFALTIPYSAAFNNGAGHRWDFYSEPLEIGNYFSDFYSNSKVQAKQKLTEDDIAHMGKNTSSQLYREISDWTFTYRVVGSSGGVKDPMFQNVYKMCGDNADMIWETEGLWFDTPSNKSAIMNEIDKNAQATYTKGSDTWTGPAYTDRYVGILPGGSFTIPGLKKNDRVIIYMGSGDGSGKDVCFLNITNARDAIGQSISSTDTYKAGGSIWNGDNKDYKLRGCYHFIAAADGPMTFYMNGGSMTKIYSIEIYTGTHRHTNDPERQADGSTVTYNGDSYTVSGYQYVHRYNNNNNLWGSYQMHYRGKGDPLRDPTVIYKSGNVTTTLSNLFWGTIKNANGNTSHHIFFKSVKGEHGMFRMRVDVMEQNNNYVADYGLQNICVGYIDKQAYPYTWDFTDLMKYSYTDSNDLIKKERSTCEAYNKPEEFMDYTMTGSDEFPADQADVKAIDQWKWYDAETNQPAGYGLQVRNSGFNGELAYPSESQLYAGNDFIAEAVGIDIQPYTTLDSKRNGHLRITDQGLSLYQRGDKEFWSIKIPEVSTDAAVYVRAKSITQTRTPRWDASTVTYSGRSNDGDYIFAVKGTGGDVVIKIGDAIIQKIAVSTDPKTVNKLGYATESRAKEIDPELMGYMTGTGLKAYTVDNVTYGNKAGEVPTIKLKVVPTTNVISAAKHHDHNGYIIYNTDAAVNGTKAVSALNNGFHLFVPDMHDRTDGTSKLKPALDVSGNCLRAWLPSNPTTEVMSQTYTYTESDGNITATGASEGVNEYTTYVLSSKGTNTATGKTETDVERFRRVAANVKAGNNKAYLPLLTENVKPKAGASAKGMFAIVFVDEEEGTETTSLNGVESTERTYSDGCYTLDGVKVQNPTKKGIYIKNGKKIIIK